MANWSNMTYEEEKAAGLWTWQNVLHTIWTIVWGCIKVIALIVWVIFKALVELAGMH